MNTKEKQEQIEELLIDFGSKFTHKLPDGKVHFNMSDVRWTAEKIVKIFSLNQPVIGSFGKFMKAVEEWRNEFTQEELDEMFKDLPNDR